jgi:20S proteasome alpha/beta subunit
MTVIAYDGKSLAADRLCVTGDTLSTAKKLFRISDTVAVSVCGGESACQALLDWIRARDTDNPAPWPECQKTDDWASLIIAGPDGCCYYNREPHPVGVIDKFAAWGVGREAALGAMAMGADAKRAVEIASEWVCGCGRGVDVVRLSMPAGSEGVG